MRRRVHLYLGVATDGLLLLLPRTAGASYLGQLEQEASALLVQHATKHVPEQILPSTTRPRGGVRIGCSMPGLRRQPWLCGAGRFGSSGAKTGRDTKPIRDGNCAQRMGSH